jgi:hypothetical protein
MVHSTPAQIKLSANHKPSRPRRSEQQRRLGAMKMKELMEILKDYSGDADVCVVMYDSENCVKSYYRIVELQVLDWGTEFELVVKKGLV